MPLKKPLTASITEGIRVVLADQDDFVDVGWLEPGSPERLGDRVLGLLDEVADEVLELGPRERHHEVLGARSRRR